MSNFLNQVLPLLAIFFLLSIALNGFSAIRIGSKFLNEYKEKKKPSYPLTREDIHKMNANYEFQPTIAMGLMNRRFRLVWQKHEDKELDRKSKLIRQLTYRALISLALFIGVFVALSIRNS
jgi:hypothetical protein